MVLARRAAGSARPTITEAWNSFLVGKPSPACLSGASYSQLQRWAAQASPAGSLARGVNSQRRTAIAPLATLRASIQGKQARAASKKVCEIRALGGGRKVLRSIAGASCPNCQLPDPAIGSPRLGFASSFALRAGSFGRRLGILGRTSAYSGKQAGGFGWRSGPKRWRE